MFIELQFLFTLTCLLFVLGLLGVIVNRKNIITVLLSLEILILSLNLNFGCLSIYLDDITGHVFVIFILTIAAAESALGLSLITCLYIIKNNIKLEPLKKKLNKI